MRKEDQGSKQEKYRGKPAQTRDYQNYPQVIRKKQYYAIEVSSGAY
jgi:hypothetical protein